MGSESRRFEPWLLALGGIVLLGFVLRVWGVKYGLPFAYNLDERSHFVPRAVEMLDSKDLNPEYQLNPSGLIELIAAALWVTKLGAGNAVEAWNTDPGQVWMIARVTSAIVATAAIALLYFAGAKLFRDRRAGLFAALVLATAFLPVHYGHLALNDAPSLAPTALALLGIGMVFWDGSRKGYLLAGLGIGLGVGLKYNAGFVLLPLLTVAAIRFFRDGERGSVMKGVLLAGVTAFLGFIVLDPYALLDFSLFRHDLEHLSDYTKGGLLLGETQTSGYRYYGWVLPWGFGLIPLLAAVGGGLVMLIQKDRRWLALVLLPAPLLVYLLVGSQGLYFARYVMPIFPILCLLAGFGMSWLVERISERRPSFATAATAIATVLLAAQGVWMTVNNDIVLSRDDTRSAAREWMVDNIPAGETILVEPIVPKEWYRDGGLPVEGRKGYRWNRFVRSRDDIRKLAKEHPGSRKNGDFANWEYTLFPGLIDFYEDKGVCWYVTASHQSGRAFRNPDRVPRALAFYRELDRRADLVYEGSPFGGKGKGPTNFAGPEHYFQYDLAFNYSPKEFEDPGPVVRVYRLNGGKCAS